jgi:hypothetical protein
MNRDDTKSAGTGRKVSRRWLLQSAATVTAGVVAAGSVTLSGAANTGSPEPATPPDHDAVTGEIFDRDRHHRWDTV